MFEIKNIIQRLIKKKLSISVAESCTGGISCERHGIDPLAYMTDVLEKLPSMSNQDDLSSLLPSNWKEPR